MFKRWSLVMFALAASPAAWATTVLLPQNATTHCSTAAPCTQPTADAVVVPLEYADGHTTPMQNFTGGGANGAMFFTVSDTPAYPASTCNMSLPAGSPPGTVLGACAPSTLSVGLALPRAVTGGVLAPIAGTVTVLLDGLRAQTLTPTPGALAPRAEDRRITVVFDATNGTQAVTQSKGNGTTWVPLGATPPLPFTFVAGGGTGPLAHLEMRIGLTAEVMSAASRQVGLGVLVRPPFPAVGGAPLPGVMSTTFPSGNLVPVGLGTTASWETLDMRVPVPVPLRMSVWNVGQMPDLAILGDGGSGEIDTIAQAIFGRQVVCLTEVWEASERMELIEEVNALRANAGLNPVWSVAETDDDVLSVGGYTGLMILSSQPILQSGVHHFPHGVCTGTDCLQDKGVMWARVQTPAGNPPPPAAAAAVPTGHNYGDFVDVFCTHVNAGDLGPGDDTTRREQQFTHVAGYMRKVRAGGPLNANDGDDFIVMDDDEFPNGTWKPGMDRPAFLLGDMNTVGPKGVESSSGLTGYNEMMSRLKLSTPTAFEASNSIFLETRDLAKAVPGANPNRTGTFVGSSCTNTIQTELGNKERLDYVFAVPPDLGAAFPTYALQLAVPSVDAHFDPVDGAACLSDHAEVRVTVNLIKVADGLKYNPSKGHRLEYRVTNVTDLETDSGCCADWFTKKVRMSANGFTRTNTFLDIIEGQSKDPGWSVTTGSAVLPDLPPGFTGTARTSLSVWEADVSPGADDHYDSIPEGGSSVAVDDRDVHLMFNASTGVLTRMRGASSSSVVETLGNFSFSFSDGVTGHFHGNDQVTENNVDSLHLFTVTEFP